MKISELSKYVVPEIDVKSGDIIEFEDAGKITEIQDENGEVRQRIQFRVRLPNGKSKLLTLNKTSSMALQKAWGDETENWVGKSAQVTILEQNVRGNYKKVIYLNPL